MEGDPKLIILGSIALDDVETPFGKKDRLLGGSASYASYAARFFTDVGIVSVVGEDFSKEYWKLLTKTGDIAGIQVGGNTFHWQGHYEYDMAAAKTLCTDLNCLEGFKPVLPPHYKGAEYVFLGNMHPTQQIEVVSQLEKPKLIAMDTMNLWIKNTKDELLEAIKKVDILILNDAEVRELFNTPHIIEAAKKALGLGLKYIIIKKGEHGAVMFSEETYFSAPGYPLEEIKDPTGCGDSFGGGLMGYIAGKDDFEETELRKAVVYGSVCASFNAEEFSLDRLRSIKKKDIEERYKEFKKIRQF